VIVDVADGYGDRQRIELEGATKLTFYAGLAGGWYDLALTAPSDPAFSYRLAGRLESSAALTSDPQLGRAAREAR
jgi:phospholipase C